MRVEKDIGRKDDQGVGADVVSDVNDRGNAFLGSKR